MRIIACLVLAASLVVGFIGALTAYVPQLERVAATSDPLHTNAPAGATTNAQGQREPIVLNRTKLSSEVISQLKEAGVERVRVREFAFGRWTGWWLYLIGAAGLLGAGIFLRKQRQIEPAAAAFGTHTVPSDPAQILAEMRRRIEGLLGVMPAEPVEDHGRMGRSRPALAASIISEVGDIQALLMPAFIDARPRLVAAFGMGGYARLMDVYAAAERAMNRAWSAAADNDEAEAISSLERAIVLLDEANRRLPGSAF